MIRSGLLISALFALGTQACTPAQGAGASEPVSATAADPAKKGSAATSDSAAPVKVKMEFPGRVAAGDKFPIIVYTPRSNKPVSLKVDDTTIGESLPWSNRMGGAYVYTMNLAKKGDRKVKIVQNGKVIAEAPIHVH